MIHPPKFFRSLRWRVQLWHGVLLALVLGILAAREWDVRVDSLKRDLDNEIYRATFLIDAAVHGRGGGVPAGAVPKGESILSPEQKARGMYYAIWGAGEALPHDVSENAPADLFKPNLEHEGMLETRPDLRAWFINSLPGHYVVVGRPLTRDYVAWRWLGVRIAGAAAAIWAVVMLAGWWLIGRELRPVRAISAVAGEIAAGDLTRRIRTGETESELGALAAVLDETFARLESSFAQQARFTADAAHELRTPVAVILTHSQNLLADDKLDGESRKAVEACERTAQWMRRMIESLLQLARLDAGREALPQEIIDLAAIAEQAVNRLRTIAAAREVKLTTDFTTTRVRGNAEGLAQVVTNLVINAIHHGSAGGSVHVTVKASGIDEALIEVADDGPGIPADHVERIFDRFYQVDPSRSGSRGSSGLGLPISRAIVSAHQGTISVRSDPGKGSTFTVRLPQA